MNDLDDYSHPTGSGSPIEDHHFALYYQGQLVTEYINPTTVDPNTGTEPSYLWMEDYVPANVTSTRAMPAKASPMPPRWPCPS